MSTVRRFQTLVSRLSLVGFLLAGCASPTTPAAATPTALPPTRAPTASPTPEPTLTPAPSPTPPPAATLSELVQVVDARQVGAVEWAAALEGQQIGVGGSVRTGLESAARLDLSDGSIVRLASDSSFELTALPAAPGDPLSRLTLLGGKIFVVLGALIPGAAVEVQTPVGSASVRGSVMGVVIAPGSGQAVVGCLEGHCTVRNAAGTQELGGKQQSAIAGPDQQPDAPQPMSADLLNDFSQIPEAQAALTGGQVIVPFIPCMADSTCETYCAPPPGSTEAPADCTAVQNALIAQGVDFERFRECLSTGGAPQQCADDNRQQP